MLGLNKDVLFGIGHLCCAGEVTKYDKSALLNLMPCGSVQIWIRTQATPRDIVMHSMICQSQHANGLEMLPTM